MTQLPKVKQNIHEHKNKSATQKHKDKLTAQPGCVNCFLLTVPIEEAARCQ